MVVADRSALYGGEFEAGSLAEGGYQDAAVGRHEVTRRLLAEPCNQPTRVLVLTTFDLAPAVRIVAGGGALLAHR